MSNNIAGQFQTLVMPAASQLVQPPKFNNALTRAVFKEQGDRSGNTVNIIVPKVSPANATNIGNGPLQISDVDETLVTLTLNQNLSVTKKIQDYDAMRTPMQFYTKYLAVAIEELTQKLETYVASFVNATTFANYTTIVGGTGVFTRLNVAQGWINIQKAGAPSIQGELHFVTTPQAYGTMLGDQTQGFLQQYIVGESAAIGAQQTARFMPQFQANMDFSQWMPLTTGLKETALFFHKTAICIGTIEQPPGDRPSVEEVAINAIPDIPMRLQVGYDFKEQGVLMHLNTVLGAAVVRPEFASFMAAV